MDSAGRCPEVEPEALTAYLYDECDAGDRERMDAHLATCIACAAELESLQTVRGALEAWTPPEPAYHVRVVSDSDSEEDGLTGWWRRSLTPSWRLATAAALVPFLLVVGAALASVEFRYDADGFVFRMGWDERSGARETNAGPEAPWSADLAGLENELRRDLTPDMALRDRATAPVVPPQTAPTLNEAAGLERVEELIQASERRQRQELALWFTEFAQEFDMQRLADQQRVQQELGALEGMADYLVRVSER